MSIGKFAEMTIEHRELEEMARVMLSEIYSAGVLRGELFERDFEKNGARRENETRGEFLRDGALFANSDNIVRKNAVYDNYSGNEGENPLAERGENSEMTRREFFEERTERRKRGRAIRLQEQAAGAAEPTLRLAGACFEGVGEKDLPEKLSDFYCRDARRYYGKFERF
ncbi:MAG: hypothetical protein RSC86_00915 [Oscillospiraceae bacterium]